MPIIAPSLLSADFTQLQKDCEMLNKSEADWYHLDVMDGRFVPNISFGPMIVQQICGLTSKYCDVHLMIEEPEKYVEAFKNAGAHNITIHVEACKHLHRNIQQIKALGIHVGVAVNPHTPVETLSDIIDEIDLVCLMSVNPGFGGQTFISNTLSKIKQLRNLLVTNKSNAKIQIDGGVTLQNAAEILKAGADVLVAGNTVFKSENPLQTISALKHIS